MRDEMRGEFEVQSSHYVRRREAGAGRADQAPIPTTPAISHVTTLVVGLKRNFINFSKSKIIIL